MNNGKKKTTLKGNCPKKEDPKGGDCDTLADRDIVKQIAREYALVAEALEKLIREYWALRPFLHRNARKEERGECIVEMTLHGHSRNHGIYESITINEALPELRKRYWTALFIRPDFVKALTAELRKELLGYIEKLGDFDVNEYNIRAIQLEMAQKTTKGIEDAILKLFDKLSHAHAWDEGSKNVHYFDGWRTNKAWKINRKAIQPLAAFEEWRGQYTFYPGRCENMLMDIEKVFSFLDTRRTPRIDIASALKQAREEKRATVALAYFDVQFYKKGTCHITFKDMDLLAKFNLFGSQRKGWLPPSYAKKAYRDMGEEERSVVASYEGESAYEKVFANPEYYIIQPIGPLRISDQS